MIIFVLEIIEFNTLNIYPKLNFKIKSRGGVGRSVSVSKSPGAWAVAGCGKGAVAVAGTGAGAGAWATKFNIISSFIISFSSSGI